MSFIELALEYKKNINFKIFAPHFERFLAAGAVFEVKIKPFPSCSLQRTIFNSEEKHRRKIIQICFALSGSKRICNIFFKGLRLEVNAGFLRETQK